MKNMRLTQKGAGILNSVTADGESRYWIGYYGLAYVADREGDSLDKAVQSGKLTESGDIIYNIWQGDMLNGYAQDNPEDTAAASLFGLTMYDKSIRTNYRYVYDPDNERNRLVAWKSVNSGRGENTLSRIGAEVYYGGYCNDDGTFEVSGMPLPAPLYYRGEPGVNPSLAEMLDNSEPVSSDFRFYTEVERDSGYGWKAAEETQDNTEHLTPANLLQSVSNFNRFHGTVSSEGYGVSSVSSCHNMSKATKLFPINYYQVVNDNGKKLAETKYSENSAAKKPMATGIKFSIDLSPVTADAGYTAINYECGDDTENKKLFESKYTSFRFNRIGIYAVKMTVHHYATDSLVDGCNMQKVQFEIDGDSEPVLFAVIDINDIIISDDPSSEDHGVAKFTLDFILNINEDKGAQLERDTAVYYNLYENDATTWYKNQLLASASISEAVTDLSLEMNAMKQHLSDKRECCASVGTGNGSETAIFGGLKNLVDGVDKEGSVRGIDTFVEGDGSEIPPISGASGNAPAGTKTTTSVETISGEVDGHSVTVPASFLYSLGFTDGHTATPLIGAEQLKLIVETKGVNWLHENLVTESGWYMAGHGGRSETEFLFVWTSATTYAKISLDTGELIEYTVGPNEESHYYTEVVIKSATEPMFADGYSIGKDTLVLGENTACAGDYSLVQGTRIYVGSKNSYTTAIGSTGITIDSDEWDSNNWLSVINSYNLNIIDSHTSLICAGSDGFKGNGLSKIDHVTDSIIAGPVSDISYLYRTILLGSGHNEGWDNGTPYDGDDVHPHISRSLMINPTLDYICTSEQVEYRSFMEAPYYENEPYVNGSLVLGGTVCGSASSSIIMGDSLAVSKFSINSVDHLNFLKDTAYSILNCGGTLVGKSPERTLILCSGSKIANYSTNVIELGGGNDSGHGWYDDISVTVDKFNADFAAGTLIPDSYYAIMGQGTIPVWNGTEHIQTQLVDGDANVFYGIYVDSNMHVSYSPVTEVRRYMPYAGGYPVFMSTSEFLRKFENGTLPSNVDFGLIGQGKIPIGNEAQRETVELVNAIDGVYYGVYTYSDSHTGEVCVGYVSDFINISTRILGKTSLVRRNPMYNTNLLVLGDSDNIGGDNRNAFILGSANNILNTRVHNLLMLGDGQKICYNYSSHFDNDTGERLPYAYNLAIFGNGTELELGSPEEYATVKYGNSLILLGSEYNACQEMYGIFPCPVGYSSRPYPPSSMGSPYIIFANSS